MIKQSAAKTTPPLTHSAGFFLLFFFFHPSASRVLAHHLGQSGDLKQMKLPHTRMVVMENKESVETPRAAPDWRESPRVTPESSNETRGDGFMFFWVEGGEMCWFNAPKRRKKKHLLASIRKKRSSGRDRHDLISQVMGLRDAALWDEGDKVRGHEET